MTCLETGKGGSQSKANWANSLWDPIWKLPTTKKAGVVAQGIDHTWFQAPVLKKYIYKYIFTSNSQR
jgi:hypothetical protein